MAFPAVQARASGTSGTSDTNTHSITLPSGITNDDLLVVIFSVDGNPTCTADAGSISRGWQKMGQASNGSTVTGAVFCKQKADGTDALTVNTSANEQSTHISLRISGGRLLALDDANGSSTNSNPPVAGTGDTAEDILWIVTRSGDSTVQASAAPSNYTNLTTQTAGGTGGASTATAERQLNASSTDPGTFTSATEQWVSWTLAVGTPRPLIETLADPFDGSVPDPARWYAWEGTPAVSGGQLVLDDGGSGSGEGLGSLDSYQLIGSSCSVHVASYTAWSFWGLAPMDDDVDQPLFAFDGANVVAVMKVQDVDNAMASVPWGPGTAWTRLRESNGTLYWEYGSDGLSWTTLYSAQPWTSTANMEFGAGVWSGAMIINGVNTNVSAPAAPPAGRFFLAYP